MLSDSLLYFDWAATALKPEPVIEAMDQFYRKEYGTVHRAVYALAQRSTEQYHSSRELVAKFIGAKDSDEIIFTRGTTDSLNTVARSFGGLVLQEGDHVLVSEIEHHANIVPWQMICQEKKASLFAIPVDDTGQICLTSLEKMLSSKTKIVAVTAFSNVVGVEFPIQRICEMAHKKGAVVVVDGAQMVPHQQVKVQSWDCDFFAFSGHKLYGPTGVGVLYGKKELLEKMPPVQGGGDMIDCVDFSGTTYADPPLRFEAGTPMIAEVIGLKAALSFINTIGMQVIKDREKKLFCYAKERFAKIDGLYFLGAPKLSLCTFYIEGVHPLDLGTMLDVKNIAVRTGHHCAQPAMRRFGVSAATRFSLSFVNSFSEIDRFFTALDSAISLLRS